MVLDFGEFKAALRGLTARLDHTFLVEEGTLRPETVTCLEGEGFTLTMLPFRTTAENLARWFFDRMSEQGLPVSQVDVYETPLNCATYRR
jgi:6-pyruvoyltetrahydropterin/6-carboxytetrahydropterin synthase